MKWTTLIWLVMTYSPSGLAMMIADPSTGIPNAANAATVSNGAASHRPSGSQVQRIDTGRQATPAPQPGQPAERRGSLLRPVDTSNASR